MHLQLIYNMITLRNYFFLQLDLNIRTPATLKIVSKNLLSSLRPANSVFDIHKSYVIKLLLRLRLGFSHLFEHKFSHCFQDTLNTMCDCVTNIETTTHFFLYYPNFHTCKTTHLNNIRNINEQILSQNGVYLTQMFLYSNLPNYNLIYFKLSN